MGRGRTMRRRCGLMMPVREWLRVGATCALLSLAPGQHAEEHRPSEGGKTGGVGDCGMHGITPWGDLPRADREDPLFVVTQCIAMGHAGEKVICKSVGVEGVVRLAAMEDFDWDVHPDKDCEYGKGAREDLDLRQWNPEKDCPAIEPPPERLEMAACDDGAHSHLPGDRQKQHITCVQACVFTIKDKCDGRWEPTPRLLPYTANQTRQIDAAVEAMMNHCGIEAAHGHDAYIFFPVVFIIFYMIAVAFFAYVYMKLLRAGPERAFTLAKAKGEIAHNEQAVLRKKPLWTKYAPSANLFFMADLDDPSNVKELGMDAAMYLEHMRLCFKFCMLQFCTLGAILSFFYFRGHAKSEVHPDLWGLVMQTWSYSGLTESEATREELWIVPFGAVWQSLSLIYFVALRQKKLNRVKLASGFSEVRSTTTLWFEDVPSDLEERVLKGWFNKAVPGKVVSVKVALDVHDLAKNIREQRKLITRINKLNADVAANRAGEEGTGKLDFAKVAEDINQSRIRLLELEEAEGPLRKSHFPGSGNIFVTFVDEMSALEFRMKHTVNEYTSDELQIEDWQCTQAPMPAELYWDNMGMKPWERRISTLKGYFLTFAAFALFCFMAGIAIFFLAWDYFGLLYSLYPVPSMDIVIQSVKFSLSPVVYYVVCGLGCLIAVLAFEEHMAHIIAKFSEYERKVTKSRVQSSYLMKAYVFYLIFHVVLSVSVFYVMTYTWLETDEPRKYTVDMWGVFHMHRACLTFGVVDPMHLFEGAKFFRRKSHDSEDRSKILSAEDEDELEADHDEFYSDHFDFSKNYGETLAIFTSCNAWTLMHPSMLLCGAAYFFIKMKIDMYCITRQYSRPSIQFSGRAKATTRIMLLSVVISNVINLWYFVYMEHDTTLETWFYFIIAFNVIAMNVHSQGKSMVPKVIRTRMKRSHQRKLQTSDWAESDSPEAGAGPESEDFTYQPPSPTTMEVGVCLETGGTKDQREREKRYVASVVAVSWPPILVAEALRARVRVVCAACSHIDDSPGQPQLPRGDSSFEGSPFTAGLKGGRVSPRLTLTNGNGNGHGHPSAFDLNSPFSGAAQRISSPREMVQPTDCFCCCRCGAFSDCTVVCRCAQGVQQWLATRDRVVSPRSSARLSVNPLAGTRSTPRASTGKEIVMDV